MNSITRAALLLLAPLLLVWPVGAQAQGPTAAPPRQAVLVLADGWDSTQATLRLYERAAKGPWKAVGAPVSTVIGRKGLAWGRGLVPSGAQGPVKREGDGKAPAGVFALGFAFGYDPPGTRRLKIPYRRMTDAFECVDDEASPEYNRIVEITPAAPKAWASSEAMRRKDELYRLGVTVDHNANPPQPGAGSCIFLHIWQGPASSTSGCTAMARKDLERVTAWLDPARNPVLVQLPVSEHAAFAKLHGLP